MAPRSRGVERLAYALRSQSLTPSICQSCRTQTPRRRHYASAAVAHATTEVPSTSQLTPDEPASGPVSQPKYIIKAGALVSRQPLVTAEPHPFETAYYLYQRRLNERLVLPFTQYFYYKRNTPAFEQWRKLKTARGGVATRDVGKYNAYTDESWNDEALVGDNAGSPQRLLEQLVDEEGRAADFTGDSNLEKTAGLRRTTEADEKNDQRSLERSLSRTLYLLVKEKARPDKRENWIFPSGPLAPKEGIAEAAKRVLDSTCGVNMNTWQVAKHPVGHFVHEYGAIESPKPEADKKEAAAAASSAEIPTAHETATEAGEKTFFIKTRIFAGQADIAQQAAEWEDFAWLSKDEIEKRVHPRYWSKVKYMLSNQ